MISKSSRRVSIVVLTIGTLAAALFGCTPTDPSPKITADSIDFGDVDPEWGTKMQACMAADGWEVTIGPDGGIGSTYSTDQESAYETSAENCRTQVEGANAGDVEIKEFSDAELRLLYNMQLSIARCLEDEGQPVGEIPSEQSYIDTYNDPDPWDPYGEIWYPGTKVTESEYGQLLEKCPRPQNQ